MLVDPSWNRAKEGTGDTDVAGVIGAQEGGTDGVSVAGTTDGAFIAKVVSSTGAEDETGVTDAEISGACITGV